MIKLKKIFKKEKSETYKKILIPIILILIGALIITVVLSIKQLGNQPQPQPNPQPEPWQEPNPEPKPQPEENPWEGCKRIDYNPEADYNFVGSLDFIEKKPTDKFLKIEKDKEKRMISLGRYSLELEPNTVLRISKLWLSFFSKELSDREDNLYGLEDSYLSRILLIVGDKSKEINLGRNGTHSFIELDDCPLGNIYPVNYQTELWFEILLEVSCNNFKDDTCFDNNNESLDYIDGADLSARIRLFAISLQDFTKNIIIPLEFRYK